MVYRKNFDIVIYQGDKVDESQGCFILWFLCVLWGHVGCGISWHALITKSDFCRVVKCGWEVLAESYHEEGKSCGTKWGVRLR